MKQTIRARYTRQQFNALPEDYRIGVIISDGMWYSVPKWRKLAKASEEGLNNWIDEHTNNGMLVQADAGARSYRFPRDSVFKWYEDHNLDIDEQLVDFLFPPRIWDDMTETEGFLAAPLREIGTVTFVCSTETSKYVAKKLQGIARVREIDPGVFKAFCLDSRMVKDLVEIALIEYGETQDKIQSTRPVIKRRELIDFSEEFAHGLVKFYREFGRTLVKASMNTIQIFLPEQEDQDAQVIAWVIEAIEKFDESSSVPFPGYLPSVLRRWPYNLPKIHLGNDLSNFQRERSRAITRLSTAAGIPVHDVDSRSLAKEMDIDHMSFLAMEERHKTWISVKHASTLSWGETGEERSGVSKGEANIRSSYAQSESDSAMAHKISMAALNAALRTDCFDDAYLLFSQIDSDELDLTRIQSASPTFIERLGVELGVLSQSEVNIENNL